MSTKSRRPSPSQSATLFKVGTKKKGNDGNIWIIKETANGIKKWFVYKKGTAESTLSKNTIHNLNLQISATIKLLAVSKGKSYTVEKIVPPKDIGVVYKKLHKTIENFFTDFWLKFWLKSWIKSKPKMTWDRSSKSSFIMKIPIKIRAEISEYNKLLERINKMIYAWDEGADDGYFEGNPSIYTSPKETYWFVFNNISINIYHNNKLIRNISGPKNYWH